MRIMLLFAAFLLLTVPPTTVAQDDEKPAPASKLLESYNIPYRLSDVKHVVVRIKVNGKGPFNCVVDTGAPAVYFGDEMAKQLGLTPKEAGFFHTFESIEVEGGLKLKNVKARVEEPFQLIGMNKINAPGMRYHGILGYSVLSQFQIEYDFTKHHLVWSRIDWTPPPPIALGSLSEGATKNMKAMVGLSMFATNLMPKKADPKFVARGQFGCELREEAKHVVITRVLEKSAASTAGLKVNDKILSLNDKEVTSLKDLQKIISSVEPEKEIDFAVQRGQDKVTGKITPVRGF